MPIGHELQPLDLGEKSKNDIITTNLPEIENRLNWVTKFPEEDRPRIIFGAIFETLAITELGKDRVENEKQSAVRQIIEEMFQNAEYLLDFNMPNKPDFVSVVFDKNGHLIVDEVVETKSSFRALQHGIDKNQPQKSLSTVHNIVKLVNTLIASNDASVIDTLSIPHNNERIGKRILREAFKKLKSAGLSDNISFSPELKYHVIVPADEINDAPEIKLTYESKTIEVIITRSKFTKKDIHSIIDHYQETP